MSDLSVARAALHDSRADGPRRHHYRRRAFSPRPDARR